MSASFSNVNTSGAYTVYYWVSTLLSCFFIGFLLAGFNEGHLAFLFLPFFIILPLSVWHKKAVVNRTKIIFENASNKITYQRGRWFVKDEDVIPVKAVDNVKIDRSVLGKIFGFCSMSLETKGSEPYALKGVSTKEAEGFRDAFIEMT